MKSIIPARRIFFAALLVVACGVWLVVALQLGRAFAPAQKMQSPPGTGGVVLREAFVYRGDFPDPFSSRLLERPKVPVRGARVAEMRLPECKIGGIVYNPVNPMFLLLYNGKSEMVKKGDVVDSMLVREIWKDSVRIVYRGRAFTLVK